MTQATLMATVGSVVRYSDMANPGSTYVVIGLPERNMTYGWWSGYKLRSVDKPYTVTDSDLRQNGWKIFNDQTEAWEKVLA